MRSRAAALMMFAFACGLWAAPVSGQEPPLGTLGEVLRSTLMQHESLQIAGEDVEQARLQKKRAFMTLSPDISFQAFGRRSGVPESDGEGGGGQGGALPSEGTDYGYTFSLNQPLYSGGRATAAYRGAGHLRDVLRLRKELLRRALLVEAAESYYGVLSSMDTVRQGEQAVVRAERHLERARKRLELGEGLVTDRLRAEVNLAEVSGNLVSFRNALADARDRVQRLCGCTLSGDPEEVKPLADLTGTAEDLVEEALGTRLEREIDRLNVTIAEEDVREKKGRFLPALSLAASYYGIGEKIDDQDTGWEAGIYLDLPLYQKASRFYLVKESGSALRQAKLRRSATAKDLSLEVRSLYNARAASKVRIETLRKQVDLARENLRLAEKRFAVGLADSLEVVDSQTALLGSEVALTAERQRYEVAKLRLTLSLGREVYPEIGQGEEE